ncbi:MAG: alpha/beta fold hydrolase [Chlamydiae bacterium]|nr:alpha/beta fold hydrolase [Chlamydiota bacterium]
MFKEFKPLLFCSGCHVQTILGSLTSFHKAPKSVRQLVVLPDKDCLTMEVCTPKGWKMTDPTVVMLHGLCGSHKSNYLQRLVKKFYKRGYRTVRLNLRGCGSARGLSRFLYHCGSGEDVIHALKELKKQTPDSPITLMGFSLGGNIVLKLAGDLGEAAKGLLTQVLAVNPPADLKESVWLIGQPKNQMYERYFIRLLRADVHYRHKRFGLPEVNIPYNMSIFEFDEYYVAPQIGFKSALDYYESCSAKGVLKDIRIPCQILFAADDPIIHSEVFEELVLPSNIEVIRTARGGHLGFIASPFGAAGVRWMDYFVLHWVEKVNSKKI